MNACNTDEAMGNFVFSSAKTSFLELDNEQIQAALQWDSAGEVAGMDNLNFRAIYSTHEMDYNYMQDRDFSPSHVDEIGVPPTFGVGRLRETDSFEMLLTADVNDRFSFIIGMHLFDDKAVNGTDCLNKLEANFADLSDPLGTTNIPCMADGGTQFEWMADRIGDGAAPYGNTDPRGPNPSGRAGNVSAESTAFFGHVTWDIADNWVLDFGGRFTDEDRAFHQVEFEMVPATCTFFNPGDPPDNQLCEGDYVLNYGAIFGGGGFYNNSEANFKEFTPMVSMTRDLQDGMLYFLYAEGFLSGAFNDELNPIVNPELSPLLAYGPEFVNNYEVGYKGTFADGRLRISTAVFFMDYTDKQEQITIDNSEGLFGNQAQLNIVTNASDVEISGIEFELRTAPWDGGFISLDMGYLNADYGSFLTFDPNDPGAGVGGIVDLSDTTIADFSPDWTINATVEHAFLLGNGATVTPLLGWYWQDDYDFEGDLDGSDLSAGRGSRSNCFQPAYSKLRLRVTYLSGAGNWQASLFGNNIADERYLEWCGQGRSGTYYRRFGQPDSWGMEFRYNWGA
jgi:outer membrane receptor protein involved in Fe transport